MCFKTILERLSRNINLNRYVPETMVVLHRPSIVSFTKGRIGVSHIRLS